MGIVFAPVQRKKWLSWSLLAITATILVGMTACATTNSITNVTVTNVATPKGTYTITITGSDDKGNSPSNGMQTVSLTVN